MPDSVVLFKIKMSPVIIKVSQPFFFASFKPSVSTGEDLDGLHPENGGEKFAPDVYKSTNG
jgi:hypothetical protein